MWQEAVQRLIESLPCTLPVPASALPHPCAYDSSAPSTSRGPPLPDVLNGISSASIADVVFRDPAHFTPGTLGENIPAWEFILLGHPDRDRILSWLRAGVDIREFMVHFRGNFQGRHFDSALPPGAEFRNHPIAESTEFSPFVDSKLQAMVASGALRRLGPVGSVSRPHVVLPVGVEPTKPRLICDARYVNLWCRDLPFSFDHLGLLPRLADSAEPMFTLDHTSGYVHVRMSPPSETYFGIQWRGVYYVYSVLSFGWKASPFVYNTLSGAVAQFLRRLGIRNLYYLDDSIYLPILRPSCDAAATVYVVCSILVWLGYFVNLDKSHFHPSCIVDWLGFTVDTSARTFSVPAKKRAKFLAYLRDLLHSSAISFKALETLAGKCASLRIAVPGAMLFTRCMYAALRQAAASGCLHIPVQGALRREMEHWLSLDSWHGTQQWRSERHVTLVIESDSSRRRWGGRMMFGSKEFRAGDDWTAFERQFHINTLEAMAFYNVLLSFRAYLTGCQVDCYIDNKTAMFSLINDGGRNPDINAVAKLIFQLQTEDNFEISYHWITSASNSVADAISREESPLRLRPALFHQLDQRFGGFAIDLLSSSANRQVGADGRAIPFFSRYSCPGSSGVNVFAQSIPPGVPTFANPPFALIGPLLAFLRVQRCYTVMVLPQHDRGRAAQYWWPLVLSAAKEWVLLAPAGGPSPFQRRDLDGTFVPLGPSPVSLWAVLLDFRVL